MSRIDLKNEVNFGLQNLHKVFESINYISSLDIDVLAKTPALTYECFGYYNAVEHLILRLTKYLKIPITSSAFSHKETVKNFNELLIKLNIHANQSTLHAILELMAFRHVATKIYGFLIDRDKLEVVAGRIKSEHSNISNLVTQVCDAILNKI